MLFTLKNIFTYLDILLLPAISETLKLILLYAGCARMNEPI